jgi:hypothetical protein
MMSFEERNTIIYIAASLLVAAIFGSRIYLGMIGGAFTGPDGLMIWARTILWMIPFGIVITIACVIVGQLIYGITTGDHDYNTNSDERDKHIGLRGVRVTMAVFTAGWIGALILLAMGHGTLSALNLMIFGGWLSDIMGNLVKIYMYRRGA